MENRIIKKYWFLKSLNFIPILFSFLIFLSCKKILTNSDGLPQTYKNNKIESPTGTLGAGDGLNDLLGWGYDVTREFANATSANFQVINIDSLKLAYPTSLNEVIGYSESYREHYGADAMAYSFQLSNFINNTSQPQLPLFGESISKYFNNAVFSNGKFDGKFIYGSYDLLLKQKRLSISADVSILKNFLTNEFKDDVNSLVGINNQLFVQKYGTHCLLDIYTGARLNIMHETETVNTNRNLAARIATKTSVKQMLNINIANDVDVTNANKNFNIKIGFGTRGGNPSIALNNTINITQNLPALEINAWKNSSNLNNAVLIDIDKNGLIFIYDLITDPIKKASLKNYIENYLVNKQVNLDYLTININRYYHKRVQDHFYAQTTVTPPGYNFEGVEFKAYSYQTPGTIPIYRFYSRSGDHFYSQSNITPLGYISEGIEFYAFNYQAPGTVPIYRYYNRRTRCGDHFYTKESSTVGGYVPEGVEFYAF